MKNRSQTVFSARDGFRCRPVRLAAFAITWLLAPLVLSGSLDAKNMAPAEPGYSLLFEHLEKLERRGDFIDAIRIIPKIYARKDIPVEAFYNTIENKRKQLLKAIIKNEISFKAGKLRLSCPETYRILDESYLSRKENSRFPVDGDLEDMQFCYLLIVEGWKLKGSKNSTAENHSAKWKDLQSVLDSPDPWLVAAAIFVARKQKNPVISQQAIVNRWQARPDLWDDNCTKQALAFIGRSEARTIRKLHINNEDIRILVENLLSIPIDQNQ